MIFDFFRCHQSKRQFQGQCEGWVVVGWVVVPCSPCYYMFFCLETFSNWSAPFEKSVEKCRKVKAFRLSSCFQIDLCCLVFCFLSFQTLWYFANLNL